MAASTVLCALLIVAPILAKEVSQEFKEQLLATLDSLGYEPDHKDEDICYQMVRRGWAQEANCGTEAERELVRRPIEKYFWAWMGPNFNIKNAITGFFENRILPEGEDHLVIWYALLYFGSTFNLDKEGDKYKISGLKDTYLLPKREDIRPHGMNTTDCAVVKQFFCHLGNRLGYIPFDYYALAIYALKNRLLTSEDIYQNADAKLFELIHFISKQDIANTGEIGFVMFLVNREEEAKLLGQEIQKAKNQEEKESLTNDLEYHKKITNMILHGWLIIRNMSMPSDGTLELKADNNETRSFLITSVSI